jgi:hypothetical protein
MEASEVVIVIVIVIVVPATPVIFIIIGITAATIAFVIIVSIVVITSSSSPLTLCSRAQSSSKMFPSFSTVGQPFCFTKGLSTFIRLHFYNPLPGLSGASFVSSLLGDPRPVPTSQ